MVLIAWVVITVAVAVAGPFGTFTQLELETRLLYWSVVVGISILVGRIVRVTVEKAMANHPIWLLESVSLATIVPVLTVIIWLISPGLVGLPIGAVPSVGVMALFVFIVAAPVAVLRRWWIGAPVDTTATDETGHPRLLLRFPEHARSEVIRLAGQGHRVKVVTSTGVGTVRIRFADAIAEMEPVLGYCAHRSHWVAHTAIKGVDQKSGRIHLVLVNGDRVPVSRKYRPGLEEAGIL